MSRVRPFTAADLAQVAALHQRLFAEGSHLSLEQRRRYLDQVFLKNPWSDGDASPSLVCETADGRLVGFLGVLRRPMSWNGQPITAAVISQFMVEPPHRGLTGFRLLATFLSGPQELSMTDGASQEAVKLWKAMGGVESPLHSLHWTRLLRPVAYGLAVLGQRVPAPSVVRPVGAAVDAMVARLRRNPFRVAPQGPDEELSVDALLEHEHHCIPRGGLRPEYDRSSLKWLLEMAEQKGSPGRLRGSLVQSAEHAKDRVRLRGPLVGVQVAIKERPQRQVVAGPQAHGAGGDLLIRPHACRVARWQQRRTERTERRLGICRPNLSAELALLRDGLRSN